MSINLVAHIGQDCPLRILKFAQRFENISIRIDRINHLRLMFGEEHCLTIQWEDIDKLECSQTDDTKLKIGFVDEIECDCGCEEDYSRVALFVVDKSTRDQLFQDLKFIKGQPFKAHATGEEHFEIAITDAIKERVLKGARCCIAQVCCCFPKHSPQKNPDEVELEEDEEEEKDSGSGR